MEKGTKSAFPFHYSREAWLRKGYCMVYIILKPKLDYVFKLLDLRQKTCSKGLEISLISGWIWQNNHLKFLTLPFQSMEWKVFGLQNVCQVRWGKRNKNLANSPCLMGQTVTSYLNGAVTPPTLRNFLLEVSLKLEVHGFLFLLLSIHKPFEHPISSNAPTVFVHHDPISPKQQQHPSAWRNLALNSPSIMLYRRY